MHIKSQKHTESAHENLTYNCSVCLSKFREKSSLTRHMKALHFNEKYQCNVCKYQATCKGNLCRHVRNVHEKSENIKSVVNVTDQFKRDI